mmetsp:Transcript_55086/g.128924  ORF Transcript_55086/g.128924 Transcript_55086/m.128924 type:complete len:200 (-) Transcript_55086:533-1132(-)
MPTVVRSTTCPAELIAAAPNFSTATHMVTALNSLDHSTAPWTAHCIPVPRPFVHKFVRGTRSSGVPRLSASEASPVVALRTANWPRFWRLLWWPTIVDESQSKSKQAAQSTHQNCDCYGLTACPRSRSAGSCTCCNTCQQERTRAAICAQNLQTRSLQRPLAVRPWTWSTIWIVCNLSHPLQTSHTCRRLRTTHAGYFL